MIMFPLTVAVATFAAGFALSLGLRRLPTLRLQLAGFGLVAAALPLAAILLSGLVMLDEDYHLPVVAIASGSAAAALVVAFVLGRSILAATDRLGAAAGRLASGDLRARAPTDEPAELAEVARGFNDMAGRIEELFDARTQLIAYASHDLRTPLASLQAMLEAIEDGLVPPDHYVPALHDQVRALSGLVDDLFELARIDSGALTLELKNHELGPLVRSCLRGLEAEAALRQVSLAADVDERAVARCAPEKVERVLFNLLTNSLRHTPSDGSVAVQAVSLPHEIRVSVEDTGAGLEPGSARHMFDRFWRGDAARSGDGAGLGLAIARGLVEAHGGRIWAENAPGGGARISFTLPAA